MNGSDPLANYPAEPPHPPPPPVHVPGPPGGDLPALEARADLDAIPEGYIAVVSITEELHVEVGGDGKTPMRLVAAILRQFAGDLERVGIAAGEPSFDGIIEKTSDPGGVYFADPDGRRASNYAATVVDQALAQEQGEHRDDT